MRGPHFFGESPATGPSPQLEGYGLPDAKRCQECGGVVGMRTWLPPYRVEPRLNGAAPGDFIQSSGAGSDLIISERFADAFRP